MSPEPAPIDFTRLTAEINEEVRRRRSAGDFPPGLERELDSLFARYAPAAAGGDFEEVLEQAERGSFVHADVPTTSRQPLARIVKRVLRPLMAFYMRFITQQVSAFAGAITRAVRLLGNRVDALERVTVCASEQMLAGLAEHRPAPDLSAWIETASAALAGVEGRILHGECGDGALLAKLVADGRDAYGVEPREPLAMAAARAGLDVRGDDLLTHLGTVPDGALSGLILSGAVDVLPLGLLLQLIERATTKLASGGVVVVLSSAPAAWARALDPVVADLSPGRPLHPQTWVHLLTTSGFTDVVSHVTPEDGTRLDTVPDVTPGAHVLNANIDRLNAMLFSPAAYAMVARRS